MQLPELRLRATRHFSYTTWHLHSSSSVAKALSGACVRLMPWWVLTTSTNSDLDDDTVLEGLRVAFSLRPRGAPSMFLEIVGSSGLVAGVAETAAWGSRRAAEAHTRTSLAFLFRWHALALLHSEATQLVSR